MDALVMMLCLAVVVGLWWWLAKRMKDGGRGWLLRHFAGSSAGMFAGLLVVALAIEVGLISPAPVEEQKGGEVAAVVQAEAQPKAASEPAAAARAPAAEEVKTLGLTPEQYAARLNQVLQKADISHRIDGRNVVKGEVNDVLQASIGTHAALVASISKASGEVLSVTVIGSGDGSGRSGLEIMMVATAALTAAASGVEFREVFQGLPEMIKGQTRTYGDVKLSVMPMNEMGTWFIAEPI